MSRDAAWSRPFRNDGGPLVVLPVQHLLSWFGADGPPQSEKLPFGPDYARACSATYPAEQIDVGEGVGLVVGSREHLADTHWLRFRGVPAAFLVAWICREEESDREVASLLREDMVKWTRQQQRMALPKGKLVLLHGASSGADVDEQAQLDDDETFAEGEALIGDALPRCLPLGRYSVDVAELGGNYERDVYHCCVARWQEVEVAPHNKRMEST